MPYSITRLPNNSFGTTKCNTSISLYNNSPSGHHQRLDASYIHVGAGHIDDTLLHLTALHSSLEAYKQLFLQIVGHIEHRKPLQAIRVQTSALKARSIQIAEETMPHSLDRDEIVAWNRFIVNEVFTLKPRCTVHIQSRSIIRTDTYQSGVQVLPYTFEVTNDNATDLLPIAIKNSTTAMEYSKARIA